MTEARLLLWLAPAPRWQRWADGRLLASGDGWPDIAADVAPVVAVPGEAVALHWVDLPELAPAQASAAARALLADQLGETDPHIAVAPGSGPRPAAAVAHAAMTGWLAELAAGGLRPAAMLPDCLLLTAPHSGWAVHRRGNRVLARSARAAFSGEADLAAALIGADATAAAEVALPAALPLDLLVGAYARAPAGLWGRRWPVAALRRLATLAAGLAGLWLAGDVAAVLQARASARAADAAVLALARPLVTATDASAAATALAALARQRGADGGLAAAAAPLLAALAATPGEGLTSLDYAPGKGLVLGVAGGADSARALADTLARAGVQPRVGTVRATADGTSTLVEVPPP